MNRLAAAGSCEGRGLGQATAGAVLWYNASMQAGAYLLGRAHGDLAAAVAEQGPTSDLIFAGQRIDGQNLSRLSFAHCTFANISFKDCVMDSVDFSNCVFVDCYFRGTRIESSKFSSSKFIECDFTKIDIRTSDFRMYNNFKGCWIPRRGLQSLLPAEPNLRYHLCMNMSDEARASGALKDAEWYRQEAVAAHEKHLRQAFAGSTEYHKEKFDLTDRVSCFFEYVGSRVRGWLWGYKRSYLVVLRNWAAATFLVFPFLFLLGREGLARQNRSADWTDIWLASVASMLPGSEISPIEYRSGFTQLVAFLEVLSALLFAGLTFSLLFRSIYERWR
ncbi:pentapeptide repeat-containing protein [Actinoplanes sp. CA-051413]|uniref:pentapeptide repeat-containing protein n=1 Tax=Actinoplanes sp. CA-051413 TaxID=3239899 RepID=UPI003D953BF1